jgi:ADP-ribose pyrophosphatase YjhB (NUDIX family)
MKLVTNCFCLKNNKILLGMKKRGHGVGKWNGYGGKIEDSETIKKGAIREIKEESGLSVQEDALEQVACLNFYFDNILVFECHVFFVHAWSGIPSETEEMRPQWYDTNSLPLSQMWVNDQQWLPLVLSGKKIKGDCYLSADGNVLEKFSWQEADFS